MSARTIKDKTVIIAGGAKNLGGLLARDFANAGARAIVIHYNSAASAADAEATVAAVKAAGSQAIAIQADLTTAAAVEKLFADATAAFGRPDIAINTVGKVLKKPMSEVTEAEYDEMSDVNAKAAFFFLKEAGRALNDNGAICTLVTSLLGAYTPFYSTYAGSKGEGMVQYASTGYLNGVGPLDLNLFFGERDAWQKIANGDRGKTKTEVRHDPVKPQVTTTPDYNDMADRKSVV